MCAGQAGTESAEIPPHVLEEAERVVSDWLSENHEDIYEMGGIGDVQTLLIRLWMLER